MANTGENQFPVDPVLRESLEAFRNFELTDAAGERIRRAVFGIVHGATPVELHDNYDGQPLNGTVRPVMDYEKARPDLMFTDRDRLHANRAVKQGEADSALIERLKAQATTGKSHQAAFFLGALGIESSN
ncbi:MAG: hypothetical protein QG553_664 [Patescibacteria group bacterium]|nr:hypothetical protein [Patescibacteria group bacterium]